MTDTSEMSYPFPHLSGTEAGVSLNPGEIGWCLHGGAQAGGQRGL